ncbi:MAG: N-acetyltransferase, partial [Daejeonella sp.]
MKKAAYGDKVLVKNILSKSFDKNQSVNYIAQQDELREKRIAALMDYSFEICYNYGDVYLSEDNKACALVLYPDRKKTTFKSIL